jgi:hypothetical protein
MFSIIVRDMPHFERASLESLARRDDNSVVFELHQNFVVCDEEEFTLRALRLDRSAHRRWRSHQPEPERASYRYETFFILSVRMEILLSRIEDRAEQLTTNVLFACLVIGHHALRGRKDGDAEAVRDLRDGLDRDIDTAARLGNAGDLADDWKRLRSTSVRSFEFGFAVAEFDSGCIRGCNLRTEERRERGRAAWKPGSKPWTSCGELRCGYG